MLAKFFKNRLKEASTYRGIIVLLGIFGVSIDPEKGDAIVAACLALYGVAAAFFPDKFGTQEAKPDPPAKAIPPPKLQGKERAGRGAKVPGQFL